MTETDRRLTEPTYLIWTLHQNHPGRRTGFTLSPGSFFTATGWTWTSVNTQTHTCCLTSGAGLWDPRLDGRRANNRSQKPEGPHPNLHRLDLQTESCCRGLKTAVTTSIWCHDVVTFHFWPEWFTKRFKIIKTVKSAEVCTKSSWFPVDRINCGFEQPSRLPDFPAKSTSLQVWWSPDIWRNAATCKLDQQSERNEYELDFSEI